MQDMSLAGGQGGPEFVSSVNPIPTMEDRLCPPGFENPTTSLHAMTSFL